MSVYRSESVGNVSDSFLLYMIVDGMDVLGDI